MQHGTVRKMAMGTKDGYGYHQHHTSTPLHRLQRCPPSQRPSRTITPPRTSPPRPGTPAEQQHNTTPVREPNLSNFSHLLWLSFSVHKQLNIHRGLLKYSTYGATQLTTSAMPEAEQYEYHTCRHSFPHVPQILYPSLRPDDIPSQYLHLTQIPSGCLVDAVTGLSSTYQVVICFDHGYQGMKKQELQEAALSRLETMGIPVATRFREPISAIVNKDTKTWLGFLRIDLLHPECDGLHLLKGERIFTLQLQNSEYVIGKVEKGFDFTSAALNRRLKLKSEALSNYTSRQLLGELTQLRYIAGTNLEFVGIAKRTKEQDTAEVTLASDISKQYLLTHPMNLGGHKVVITTPSNDTATNPNSPTALTTTIVVKGLPLNIMQVQVTAAIHRLLGPKNVITVSFDRAQEDALGRHDGTAIIRCLNVAVYTHWCNRKAVPLLGRQVDFTPHSKSISGSAPHVVSKAQDSKPTREVIAEALTALRNESSPGPSLQQLESSLQKVELQIETSFHTAKHRIMEQLKRMDNTVNAHTTATVNNAIEVQQTNNSFLIRHIQALTDASQQYNKHVSGISTALLQAHSSPGRPTRGLPNHEFLHD